MRCASGPNSGHVIADGRIPPYRSGRTISSDSSTDETRPLATPFPNSRCLNEVCGLIPASQGRRANYVLDAWRHGGRSGARLCNSAPAVPPIW